MFQELRRLLSIHGHLQPSNRVTPSQNRHINGLPTELLIMIFQGCCDYCDYYPKSDPISLSLVCRFWHTIVTACPALWATITFDPGKLYKHDCFRSKDRPIFRSDRSNLERALRRAGTATLSLEFRINLKLYLHNEEEHVLPIFGRCRDLHITLVNTDAYAFASSIAMPHLEHLTLQIENYARIEIEPLLDSIERRSPLFRSLSIIGSIPTNLARHKSLLRRIVHLNLIDIKILNISFQGLQNVEELKIYFLTGYAIKSVPSDLPKLVSLCISGWGDIAPLNIPGREYSTGDSLPTSQQLMTFPLLEILTLDGKWSNLQFIVAPKLRNLVLANRYRYEPEGVTMSALRRSTVRPISLSIDFVSDTYLTELLKLWSNLSELHLRGRGNYCIPGAITTAALAGNRRMVPYCSSLRYLIVHCDQSHPDRNPTNLSIQRLQRIVKKRKGYGVVGLQRVMCVWRTRYDWGVPSEPEWVDVL